MHSPRTLRESRVMESKSNKRQNGIVPAKQAKGKPKPSRAQRKLKTARQPVKPDTKIRVRHSEFISEVKASGNTESRVINAGNDETFQWLSTVARNYEYYSFRALKFRYVPLVNNAEGSVLLTVDFDCGDALITDKRTLFNFEGTVRSMLCKPCTFICPKRNLQVMTKRPVDSVRVGEPRLANVGNLIWQSMGDSFQAAGEIWVDYDVDLFIPQANAPKGPEGSQVTSRPEALDKLFANALSIGPDQAIVTDSTIGMKRPGNYLVDIIMEGQNVKSVPDFSPTPNCEVKPLSAIIDGNLRRGLVSFLVSATSAWMVGASMKGKADSVNSMITNVAPYFRV